MAHQTVKVTLKMIAEQAGTSIGTVDRALMGRPGIHPDTKNRVLLVAKDLGYKPNRFASALSRKRTIRIGMVYPSKPTGFYQEIDRGVDKAAEELRQYGVEIEKIRHQTQNPTEQAQLLRETDTARFDGMAVNSSGHASAMEIDRLTRENIPVITFNTDAAESGRLFFIGNDSRQSGRMGAELLGRYLGGKGSVTVMGNFIQATPFSERFGGFCEVIHNEYHEIKLFPCAECSGDSQMAAKNLLDALSQMPSMGGVFCTGHSSTVGAIEALKRLDRKDIVLIGFDTGGGSLEALKEGWCDALLFQDPFKQAYQAAHLLSKHILEGWVPDHPLLHVETSIVIRHNLSSYQNREYPMDRFL